METKKRRIISYEPSPRDIRHACDEIQATWSPRTRRRRECGVKAKPYTIPQVFIGDLDFDQDMRTVSEAGCYWEQ